MSKLEAMLEAERRGILPDNMKGLLDEARKRGLVDARPPSPTVAETVSDVGEQAVRGINRGLNAIASLPGEIVGGAADLMGFDGDKFRWNNQVSQFMSSPNAQPTTTAGRFADSVGQAVGASAAPAGLLLGRAAQGVQGARQAATTMGQIGQNMVAATRAAPAAVVGADVASAVGAGVGQQAAEEGGFGPAGQALGAVMGGMAPHAIASAGRGAVNAYRSARANMGEAGAYGRVARALPDEDVNRLADDVAVGATTRDLNTQRRTLDVLGEEMERAGGNVRQAEQATINRLMQEFGVARSTAQDNLRNLSSVHRNSELMFSEYPAVARSDVDTRRMRAPSLDDLNRIDNAGTQELVDYLANSGTAQSSMMTRNAVTGRQENLAPAMRGVLERIGPQVVHQAGGRPRPAMIEDAADMIDQARQMAQQSYRAAYQGPINTRVLVHFLPRLMNVAQNYASGRAGDVRRALEAAIDQFYITTPQGQRVAMQTLQQVQDARGVLRGQIAAYRRQGRDDLANAVQRIYTGATRLMTAASPQWARANRQWADMEFERIGQELGDAFAQKAGPQFRQQMAEFDALAPRAQDIVRIHALQRIYDKLDNLADTHSVSKLFSSDHARNMIRRLFGDDAARTFTRAVRDQKAAEITQGALGNSKTATRLARREQEETETGLVAAVQNARPSAILDWVMKMGAQVLTEHRKRPMARILTTPMRDTAQVAHHLYRLRQQQDRLRQMAAPALQAPSGSGVAGGLLNIGEDEAR